MGASCLRWRVLVVGIYRLPEGARLLVEGDGHVRRVALAQGLQEHQREPVDRVGRHALAVREVRDGVVGAEDVRAAVYQGQRGSLGVHGGREARQAFFKGSSGPVADR